MLRDPGLYGSTLRERSIGDFTMTERAYPARYATPAHVHDCPLFCVVLDGSYEEVHGGRQFECTSSTVLFHAAYEEHLERFGQTGGRSLIGARLYREFLTGDDASGLIIEGLLLEISGEFLRVRRNSGQQAPLWLRDARDFIHANFARRITLAEIGKAANAHPVHVAQTFRRFHHCTIGDYLRKLRVEFACRELAEGRAGLAEIAGRAGFSDQSHFNRIFKRLVGVAPSAYRSSARRS
jgi:AraC family transcriptional regulator